MARLNAQTRQEQIIELLNNNGSTFPVEVQFVGYSEVFMYEELDFLNSNIEDD